METASTRPWGSIWTVHETGFRNYYSTRYLIWANDAAKEVWETTLPARGGYCPCFLMNELFRLCSWEGPAYMQATQQLMT